MEYLRSGCGLLLAGWLAAVPTAGCGGDPAADDSSDPSPVAPDPLGVVGDTLVLRALPAHPPRFGKTYDSVADSLGDATCVTYDLPRPLASSQVDARYDLVIVKSYRDLQNALGVSYQTSAGVGMFKDTAAYSVASDFHFTSNKVVAIFLAEVLGPTQELDNPQILPSMIGTHRTFEDFYLGSPCGDRYVASIQAGAKLTMTLEITTGSYEEKLAVEAQLQEKSIGFKATGSIDNDLRTTISSYQSELHVEIVGAPSCNFGMPANTLDGFLAKARSFSDDVHACLGFDKVNGTYDLDHFDVSRSPYLVTYLPLAPYFPGAQPLVQPVNMQRRIEWYQRWQTLALDIGYMVARPDEFDLASTPAYDTPGELQEAVGWINLKAATLLDQIEACERSPADCTDAPDPSLDPAPIEGGLPNRKPFFPETCAAYKTLHRDVSFPDAAYLLYLGGDPARQYEVYCRGMQTASPTEYLDLGNSSLPASPRYNYTHKHQSQYDSHHVLRTIESNTFAWTKLRVVPHATYLDVDLNDHGYGASASTGRNTTAFGSPWGCSGSRTSVVESSANVDFAGLPFAIDPAVVWGPGGYLGRGHATVSDDRKSVDLAGDGSCGGWVPGKGIQLLWSP